MKRRELTYQGILFVVFLIMLLPLRNGFTDDGFIHIQYARNLANHAEYSFNAGEVSFGTTSPLWVMAQAALAKVFGSDESLIVMSRVLSWLCGFGAVFLMFRFARAAGLGLLSTFACALMLAVHVWHVRWTALSMETSASVLAMVGVGIASMTAFSDRRGAMLLGFTMGIAALLRPEAYLMLPVYLLSIAFRGRQIDWGCVGRTLSIFFLLLLPWLLFAKFHIGSFLPNTAGAKSGGLTLNPLVLLQKFEPIAKISGVAEGVLLLIVLVSVLAMRTRSRVFSHRYRFLFLWLLALPSAYVLFDIQVLSRYMLLTTPAAIVLGFVAMSELADKFGLSQRSTRAVAIAVMGVAVIINVVFYATVVVPPSRAFSRDLTTQLKKLALYINENSDSSAVVAAADIGYLSFYSQRRILDLGGLVDTETNALRETYTYEEIIDGGLYLDLPKFPRVDFFIDRALTKDRFTTFTAKGYRFESVMVVPVDNLGIKKPGPFFYTLYRLHREADD